MPNPTQDPKHTAAFDLTGFSVTLASGNAGASIETLRPEERSTLFQICQTFLQSNGQKGQSFSQMPKREYSYLQIFQALQDYGFILRMREQVDSPEFLPTVAGLKLIIENPFAFKNESTLRPILTQDEKKLIIPSEELVVSFVSHLRKNYPNQHLKLPEIAKILNVGTEDCLELLKRSEHFLSAIKENHIQIFNGTIVVYTIARRKASEPLVEKLPPAVSETSSISLNSASISRGDVAAKLVDAKGKIVNLLPKLPTNFSLAIIKELAQHSKVVLPSDILLRTALSSLVADGQIDQSGATYIRPLGSKDSVGVDAASFQRAELSRKMLSAFLRHRDFAGSAATKLESYAKGLEVSPEDLILAIKSHPHPDMINAIKDRRILLSKKHLEQLGSLI